MSFPPSLRPPRIDGVAYTTIQQAPVYTIHTLQPPAHRVFTLSIDDVNDAPRTFVSVFLKREEAELFSILLESQKKAAGEFPCTFGSPNMDLTKDAIQEAFHSRSANLKELYTEEWLETEIQDFCVHYNFNLLVFDTVKRDKANGSIQMAFHTNEIVNSSEFLRRRFSKSIRLPPPTI